MFDEVILLDGGMGQELYRRGIRGDELLWSATALIEAPEAVRDIHIEFIEAGAQVITTNTYSTKPARLSRVGLDDQIEPLNRLACELALEAREKAGKPDVKIAASIPPQYSYRPDIVIDPGIMRAEYEIMVELLNPHVDLFLCETMTDAAEARAATTACAKTGKPVWCAWTFKDDASGHLRNGDTVADTVAAMKDIAIEAYMVNCCAPEGVAAIVSQLRREASETGQIIGAYANGFTFIPDQWQAGKIQDLGVRRDLSPSDYCKFVAQWIEAGTGIVGGCCEIGPYHIRAIHQMLGRMT